MKSVHPTVLTDEKISELIVTKKKIITPPKRNFSPDKNGHPNLNNEFTCKSINNENDTFHVFLRKNCIVIDNFSIGLCYRNSILIRVNGKQIHKNKDDGTKFYDFHIHKLTEYDIRQGNTSGQHADPCKEYSNFNSALLHFCKICGIMGIDEYFSNLLQISFEELP
jgi:hypothetical protein